jgi:hypothetical protein
MNVLQIPRQSTQPCNHHYLRVKHCAYLLFTAKLRIGIARFRQRMFIMHHTRWIPDSNYLISELYHHQYFGF